MAFTYGTTLATRNFSVYLITAATTSTTTGTILTATFSMSAGWTSSSYTFTAGASVDFLTSATQIGVFEFGTVTMTTENSTTVKTEETGVDLVAERTVTIEGNLIGLGTGTALASNTKALADWQAKDEVIVLLYNTSSSVIYVFPRQKFTFNFGTQDSYENRSISCVKSAGNLDDLVRYWKYPV